MRRRTPSLASALAWSGTAAVAIIVPASFIAAASILASGSIGGSTISPRSRAAASDPPFDHQLRRVEYPARAEDRGSVHEDDPMERGIHACVEVDPAIGEQRRPLRHLSGFDDARRYLMQDLGVCGSEQLRLAAELVVERSGRNPGSLDDLGHRDRGVAALGEQRASCADERGASGLGAAGGSVIFETDDCRATYESLCAKGVEFTQAPTERFYGIDCGLRDPFGNPMRITQPPKGPVVLPSAAEFQAQS